MAPELIRGHLFYVLHGSVVTYGIENVSPYFFYMTLIMNNP